MQNGPQYIKGSCYDTIIHNRTLIDSIYSCLRETDTCLHQKLASYSVETQ